MNSRWHSPVLQPPEDRVVAVVSWRAPLFVVGASAWADTGTAAVASLGAFLDDHWPAHDLVQRAFAGLDQRSEPGRTEVLEGVAVTSPDPAGADNALAIWSAGHAMATVRAPAGHWLRALSHALDRMPLRAADALNRTYADAGSPLPAQLPVTVARQAALLQVVALAGPWSRRTSS